MSILLPCIDSISSFSTASSICLWCCGTAIVSSITSRIVYLFCHSARVSISLAVFHLCRVHQCPLRLLALFVYLHKRSLENVGLCLELLWIDEKDKCTNTGVVCFRWKLWRSVSVKVFLVHSFRVSLFRLVSKVSFRRRLVLKSRPIVPCSWLLGCQ